MSSLDLWFKYALHLQQIIKIVILVSEMKKLKFVVVLFLMIFAQNAFCGHKSQDQIFSLQKGSDNNSNFESTDFQLYIFGEVPSAQVLFNPISQTLTLFSKRDKAKELFIRLTHPRAKIYSNLFFTQYSFFSRYCSVFMQIFLKTACFRL